MFAIRIFQYQHPSVNEFVKFWNVKNDCPSRNAIGRVVPDFFAAMQPLKSAVAFGQGSKHEGPSPNGHPTTEHGQEYVVAKNDAFEQRAVSLYVERVAYGIEQGLWQQVQKDWKKWECGMKKHR